MLLSTRKLMKPVELRRDSPGDSADQRPGCTGPGSGRDRAPGRVDCPGADFR
jgi:hypothetical protein